MGEKQEKPSLAETFSFMLSKTSDCARVNLYHLGKSLGRLTKTNSDGLATATSASQTPFSAPYHSSNESTPTSLSVFYRLHGPFIQSSLHPSVARSTKSRAKDHIQHLPLAQYLLLLQQDPTFHVFHCPLDPSTWSCITIESLLDFFPDGLRHLVKNPFYHVKYRCLIALDPKAHQTFRYVWWDVHDDLLHSAPLAIYPPNSIYLKLLVLPIQSVSSDTPLSKPSKLTHPPLSINGHKVTHFFNPRLSENTHHVTPLHNQSNHSLLVDTVSHSKDYSRDLPEETSSRNLPEETSSRDLPEETSSKDLPEETSSRDLPKETSSRDLPEETSSRDLPEETSSRFSVENDSNQKAGDNTFTFVPDSLKQELDQWCFHTNGCYKDARVLLGSLPQVLWKGCPWVPIPLCDIFSMELPRFKQCFRQLLLLCHPDKHYHSTAEIQYRAHRILQAFTEAYRILQDSYASKPCA